MKLLNAIKQLFRRKPIVGSGSFTYDVCRYISKSGGDILPGPVPVPVGDELQSTIFKNDKYTMVAMCIYEKIIWLIPWHYDEYIILFNTSDFDYDGATAEDIVKLIDEAENWNKRDKLTPVDVGEGSFIFIRSSDGVPSHSYSTDNGDYIVLKMRNVE